MRTGGVLCVTLPAIVVPLAYDGEPWRMLMLVFSGYGATTLPSITEALTFDGNATLAELEASRVGTLLDKLTETIKV